MPRLFTALEIPPDVGQALGMLRGGLPGARWINPENYHLTLRFIGDIDDALAHEIAMLLGRVRREAFTMQFDGLAAFGGRKPRAVFAAAAPSTPLVELQAEQERLLRRLGRQVADYLATRGHFRSLPFPISRFVLFSSKASSGGGPYVVEADYPLA